MGAVVTPPSRTASGSGFFFFSSRRGPFPGLGNQHLPPQRPEEQDRIDPQCQLEGFLGRLERGGPRSKAEQRPGLTGLVEHDRETRGDEPDQSVPELTLPNSEE